MFPSPATGKREVEVQTTAVSFTPAIIAKTGNIIENTAAVTLTLGNRFDYPEGFEFGGKAVGGTVTFSGTANFGKTGKTVVAQGDSYHVYAGKAAWNVQGVSA